MSGSELSNKSSLIRPCFRLIFQFARITTLGFAVVQLTSTARAAEGSVYGGPVGGTDIRNAVVAPPGVYFGFANVPGYATSITGNNGGRSTTATRVNLVYDIQALGAAYVYPFKLFDGSLSSAVQVSYDLYIRFSINNHTERISGWGDLYSDIIKYTKYLGVAAAPSPGAPPLPYGLTVQAAYSMIFPIGAYTTYQFTTSGHNDYFVIPNAAMTYLTKPNFLGDGLELDLHVFYDHALKNPTTNYSSGDIIDLDFAVSERSGRLQYGVAGFGALQISKDTRNGVTVPVDGKHYASIKVGPVVAYDFPTLGLTLKAKVGLPVYSRNTIFAPQAVLSAGLRF